MVNEQTYAEEGGSVRKSEGSSPTISTNLIESLLRRVGNLDPKLAEDLRRAVNNVTSEREFGLVFNRHMPETVELPGRKVRKGDKVRIVGDKRETTWDVVRVRRLGGNRVADILRQSGTDEMRELPLDDLVAVADFRDAIYPGLRCTGSISRGGDKPSHVVINGENHHTLEALTFSYAEKVDCIYIDPPYNTRDKDWKYNNDYVDSNDDYKHSKWLSFMERRLRLAKKLLNPANSVLIVTIDEKEYLRLGMLLDQLFPAARIQMVSSVINPGGVSRDSGFRRTDEYIFFVMIGRSAPSRLQLSSEWSNSESGADELSTSDRPDEPEAQTPDWTSMMRRGADSTRADRPSMFYPIYVDSKTIKISDIGEEIPAGVHEAPERQGMVAILPLRRNGSEGRWQISSAELRARMAKGRVRLGRKTAYGYVVNYLADGAYADVLSDSFEITGFADDGSLVASGLRDQKRIATTQWKLKAHNADTNGTSLLANFIPGRKFPYPKSLYAVEDAIRFFVAGNPHAIILDFFGGSGTTAHAVMRLNRQDGGSRRSIIVTNNEVSSDESEALRGRGLRPGDAEWESLGICEYITKPRIAAAVTGKTHEGKAIVGDYKFTNEFPMSEGFEENVEFFTLTYENPEAVRLDYAFAAIAPLLWLKAGAQGSCIDKREGPFALADYYAVLFDPDQWGRFIKAIKEIDNLRCVYIVTDDDTVFQKVSVKVPRDVNEHPVQVIRLYESYLNNFEIKAES